MSENLKVQIPDGYRWVEIGEKQNGKEWLVIVNNYWVKPHYFGECLSRYKFITPVEPPKPDTVDVEIFALNGFLHIVDPNTQYASYIHNVPCIVGPDWRFAGFVWDDGELTDYYHLMVMGEIKYAKAVRFRRVGGVK